MQPPRLSHMETLPPAPRSLRPLSACSCFTDDTTGIHSVYTLYQGHEIMFHVSTMLPYSKENKQQVGASAGPHT